MKLIKKLNTRRDNNGEWRRFGLFYCEYCRNKVKKRYDHGLKNKSCGCVASKLISKAGITHGCACNGQKTRLYRIWTNMKGRCYDSNSTGYSNYGGRGIKICNEWLNDYVIFRIWALSHGYRKELQIDRRENDGNYEPSNCKWVTCKENNRNKRTNKLTLKKAQQIRSLYFNIKIEKKLLGRIFGVSGQHIGNIIHNKKWV